MTDCWDRKPGENVYITEQTNRACLEIVSKKPQTLISICPIMGHKNCANVLSNRSLSYVVEQNQNLHL